MRTEIEIREEHKRIGKIALETQNQMLSILLIEKMKMLEWVLENGE